MTNQNYAPVLQQLAAMERVDVTDLYIKGFLVFKRRDGVMADLVCQIDKRYWNEAKAAADVLTQLRRR